MHKSNPSVNHTKPQEQSGQQTYEIPVEGSLGLLAVGARGLIAWREKRATMAKHKGASDE